jgi:hypothetical protein
MTIKRVAGGEVLLSHSGAADMWDDNAGAHDIKFGIYRSLNNRDALRDEQVRFADFCASKQSATDCDDGAPPPPVAAADAGAPGPLDASAGAPPPAPVSPDASAGPGPTTGEPPPSGPSPPPSPPSGPPAGGSSGCTVGPAGATSGGTAATICLLAGALGMLRRRRRR